MFIHQSLASLLNALETKRYLWHDMPTNMHQEHWCCHHPLSYSNHYCAPDATAMLGTLAEDIALTLLNCHDTSTMSPTPTWRTSSLEKQSDFPNVTQLAKYQNQDTHPCIDKILCSSQSSTVLPHLYIKQMSIPCHVIPTFTYVMEFFSYSYYI